jgi:hypothetical protein
MRRIIVYLFAVTVVSLLSGCATQKRVIAVSPLQFEAAYRLPSWWALKTKFHSDAQYTDIDFYRWGALSLIEYTGTWRISTENVPSGLLREARTAFLNGPDLNENQKAMLDAAMKTARQAGLFDPAIFPDAPSIADQNVSFKPPYKTQDKTLGNTPLFDPTNK